MHLSSVFWILLFLVFSSNALTKNASIVIIGAGAAGIAAASKLLENSFTNIKILEAQNRIGGRIHSVEFAKEFVDLGAQYCHGEKGNVVYELVEKLDLLQDSNLTKPELIKIYDSDGNILIPELEAEIVKSIQLYTNGSINLGPNVNLRDAFLETYNETVLKKYANDKVKLKLATDAIRVLHAQVNAYEGSFSWDDVSSISRFEDSEGNPNLSWKTRGYHIILDILMKNYPDPSQKLPIDDKIFLDKKVQKIIWNETSVRVETSDNNSITAEHVIFTPSVGVLKAEINTMFEPQLPKGKQDAVEAIGFDGIMKIILHFPERWWGTNDYAFSFLWSEEDLLKSGKDFPDGPQKNGVSWVSNIASFVKPNIDSNILIGWLTFDLIPEIEQTSDEILLKGCNYIIKKFFGKDYNVTEADKVIRSQWKSNSNFRGAYSYLRFGYYKQNVSYNAMLAEPLTNKEGSISLQFAGEATNCNHFSTVHGAIETGRREAERIINLYK